MERLSGGRGRASMPQGRRERDFMGLSVEGLFGAVSDFALEKRRQSQDLEMTGRAINEAYGSFPPEERVRFFSMLYDRFAERYDEHMGIETRHYQAIERVLQFAAPHMILPLLDITAGTGEPLKQALEIIRTGARMRAAGLRAPNPAQNSEIVVANEVSPKMLEKAGEKLGDVELSCASAFDYARDNAGRFSTVLCSQTFHIISDEDKLGLVHAIRRSLAPGGIAIVVEEDPFRISQTPQIEAVSLFLRAIVRPIKVDALIGRFEACGFEKLEERAAAPIDSEHIMRLHLFRNVTQH